MFAENSLDMRSMTMSTESCSGRRALVVEDDAAIRKITWHALQKAGYEVLEACTADEAIAYVGDREANLDAIVTDVEMPGAPTRNSAITAGPLTSASSASRRSPTKAI